MIGKTSPAQKITPKGEQYAEEVLKELDSYPKKNLIARPVYGRLRSKQIDIGILEELK